MKKILLIVVFVVIPFLNVFASEESTLGLSIIQLEAEGREGAGPVSVLAERNAMNEFVSLKIKAFGQEYTMSHEELQKIPALPYNGIQLSYEPGYEITGGKTIYLKLFMGFTSSMSHEVLVTINEEGTFRVGDTIPRRTS